MELSLEVTRFIEERQGIEKERLLQVRELTERYLPETKECIKYGIPALVFRKNLFFYSGYPHHIGIYPTPAVLETFQDRLRDFSVSKGGFQIPHEREMPVELLKEMLQYIHREKIEKERG